VDTYKRLNITYDVYSGESKVSQESIEHANAVLAEKGLALEDKGAILVNLEKFKLAKPLIRKRDGTSLYLTRDIGAAKQRYDEYKFDKMIYVVASQQDLHLKQLFKVLELMGYDWANKCQHVNFGMVLGMSTRKGNVVKLDDMLDTAKESMHDIMRKNEDKYVQVHDPEGTADTVGKAAIMIQDMSAKRYPLALCN
jgi:arginyl-tRNA synthetase